MGLKNTSTTEEVKHSENLEGTGLVDPKVPGVLLQELSLTPLVDEDLKPVRGEAEIDTFIQNLQSLITKYTAKRRLQEGHLVVDRLNLILDEMEVQKRKYISEFAHHGTTPFDSPAKLVEGEIKNLRRALKRRAGEAKIEEMNAAWDSFENNRSAYKAIAVVVISLAAIVGSVVAGYFFGMTAAVMAPGLLIGAAAIAIPAAFMYLTAKFFANRARNDATQLGRTLKRSAELLPDNNTLKVTNNKNQAQIVSLNVVDLNKYLGCPAENSQRKPEGILPPADDYPILTSPLTYPNINVIDNNAPPTRRAQTQVVGNRFFPFTPSAEEIALKTIQEKAHRDYKNEHIQVAVQAQIKQIGGYKFAPDDVKAGSDIVENYYVIQNANSLDGKFVEKTDMIRQNGKAYYAAVLPAVSLDMRQSDAYPLQMFLNKDCGSNFYDKDVFSELLPLLKEQETQYSQDIQYARILFPVSASTIVGGRRYSHWITFEINIKRIPANAQGLQDEETPNSFVIDIDYHDAKQIPEIIALIHGSKILAKLSEQIQDRIQSSDEYKDNNLNENSFDFGTNQGDLKPRQTQSNDCGPIVTNDIFVRVNGQDFGTQVADTVTFRKEQLQVVKDAFPPENCNAGRDFVEQYDTSVLTKADLCPVLAPHQKDNVFKLQFKEALDKKGVAVTNDAKSLLDVPPGFTAPIKQKSNNSQPIKVEAKNNPSTKPVIPLGGETGPGGFIKKQSQPAWFQLNNPLPGQALSVDDKQLGSPSAAQQGNNTPSPF